MVSREGTKLTIDLAQPFAVFSCLQMSHSESHDGSASSGCCYTVDDNQTGARATVPPQVVGEFCGVVTGCMQHAAFLPEAHLSTVPSEQRLNCPSPVNYGGSFANIRRSCRRATT